MEPRNLTDRTIELFHRHMLQEEKSAATIEKYLRDVRAFSVFTGGAAVTKELSVQYKKHLLDHHYAIRSVNSMLASLNSLFSFLGWQECKVKAIKQQRAIYCAEDQELTKEEYLRLLHAAQHNTQLQLIMETICATGIRVSELQYFTAESLSQNEVQVNCKGKNRTVFIPGKLRKKLLGFAKHNKIRSGPIFRSRNGSPLSRSSIWEQMKALCKAAAVNPKKVFPHNLRKLFARTFYRVEKDIAKLADILGHSSINTTRIYIVATGAEHRKKIECLGLVL